VRKCPDVRFILDHICKPDIRNQIFEPWKTHLKELSGMSNMWCKMSGLATEADHKNWKQEDLKPYIHHVLECFGFDRVMYGGDWPVASLATGYQRWVQVLERAVQGCSKTELKKLFHDNAVAFYKMG
jgi:L-fuconolactonase